MASNALVTDWNVGNSQDGLTHLVGRYTDLEVGQVYPSCRQQNG